MPVEAKDILTYLGIENVDNIDSLKEKFDSDFVRRSALKDPKSEAHKEYFPIAIGKLDGIIRKNLLKNAKDSGVEIGDDEIKGKQLEDVVDIVYNKTKDVFGAKIIDLESKVGQGKDEAVKEWETKFEKLNKKFTDLDGLHKGLQTTYESEKGGWQNQIKGIKLENILAKKHEGIKWATSAKPLEKEGFFAHLKNNYKVDLDENGNLGVFDKSGNPIPNPAKAGTWKTYDDILPEDGMKLDIWEKNPHAQTPQRQTTIQTQTPQTNIPNQGIRKVSGSIKVQKIIVGIQLSLLLLT